MTIQRGESRIPLETSVDTEAEFADDGGPIAPAVVVAGCVEVSGGGQADAGVIFEVAVVVVGGEGVVCEVLLGFAGAP